MQDHDLVSLSTWNAKSGPSFIHGSHSSRIDHVFCRRFQCDRPAKQACFVADAPFLPLDGPHHVPIICNLPKPFVRYGQKNHPRKISHAQKLKCRTAWHDYTDDWDKFVQLSDGCISNIAAHDLNGCAIQNMHDALIDTFHECFPAQRTAKGTKGHAGLVSQKWHHHAMICKLKRRSFGIRQVFEFWHHVTAFRTLDKQHRKWVLHSKKQLMWEVIAEADKAARRHDSFSLFQLVHRFTPKTARRSMKLRNAQGHPAGPVEVVALLSRFVQDTWCGDEMVCVDSHICLGVPFTEADLAAALRAIPAMKGVSSNCCPGFPFVIHADRMAAILYPMLQRWWGSPDPWIPQIWRNGHLLMIPKPQKATHSASLLRPLALQDPVGKAILGILTQIAMMETRHELTRYPQFAFLGYRSSLDAIVRVTQHAKYVRSLVQSQRPTVQQRALKTPKHVVCGGAQIHIDIKRAFDQADRTVIFRRLALLSITPAVRVLMQAWHKDTCYVVEHAGYQETIGVQKGVRQGCKAAPYLWCVLTDELFSRLSAMLDEQWVKRCLTLFADDLCVSITFTDANMLHAELEKVGKVLDTVEALGLPICDDKSRVLLALGGTSYTKHQAAIQHHTASGVSLCIPRGEKRIMHIPITDKLRYLGVIVSFRNMEKQTLDHRIDAATMTCRRLSRWLHNKRLPIQAKLNMWRSCVFQSLQYGLLAVGLTQTGLDRLQHITIHMLRKIIADHSYLTRRTHFEALATYQQYWPLNLLLRSTTRLQQNLDNRVSQLAPDDILHDVDWTHLRIIHQLLVNLQSTGPLSFQPDDHHAGGPPASVYSCDLCAFTTHTAANLQRHRTQVHKLRRGRTHVMPSVLPSVNGLPQCSHCMQPFTTWTSFYAHVESAVCQVKNLEGSHAPATGTFNDRDLAFLQEQEVGQFILEKIASRDWEALLENAQATELLSTRCILCGMFQARTQSFNTHLRQQHHSYVEHVFLKAAQLFRAHGGDSPCKASGTNYKRQHMCIAWTQISMLFLHLPPAISGTLANKHTLILQCEVCRIRFQDTRHLLLHLRQHQIVVQDWVASRDSFNRSPVCAHCSATFGTMSGLQYHIINGQCREFQETADTCSTPVDHSLLTLFQTEHLYSTEVTLDFAALTTRCQCCGRTFRRRGDLSQHLQTQHGTLWETSQTLLKFLTAITTQSGCICSPAVQAKRSDHVCVPARQIAMQFYRTELEFWVPFELRWDLCRPLLEPFLTPSLLDLICRTLTTKDLHHLWLLPTLTGVMRTQCLWCGMKFDARATVDLQHHLLQEHPHTHPYREHLQQHLLPCFQRCVHDERQCPFCDASIPEPADGSNTVARHLLEDCPVTLQILLLLESCDGWANGLATGGGGTADGVIPGLGADALQSDDAQCQHVHAADSADWQETDAGSRGQRVQTSPADRHAESHDLDGKVDFATGARHESLEDARYIHPVFESGLQGYDASSLAGQSTLEAADGANSFQARTDAPPCSPCPGALSGDDHPLSKSGQFSGLRCFESADGQGTDSPAGSNMAISHLGWETAGDQPGSPRAVNERHELLEGITENLTSRTSVVRFHALPAQSGQTVTWRLQVPFQMTELTGLLRQLTANSVFTLIAAQFKQHRPAPSALAVQLQQTMHLPGPKGKGKGKKGTPTPPAPQKYQKR
eukprot:Skav231107  [mRNA]  locus=scaffold2525:483158:488152:- [translate_table: standard]